MQGWDSQCSFVYDLGCDHSLCEANRLSTSTENGKPNHDFVFCLCVVLRLGLIAIQKHIDGHVGVDVVFSELHVVCRYSSHIAHPVCPLHVDFNMFQTLNFDWHNSIVDLDVRERVYWCAVWTWRILPRYREFRSRGVCGISLVIECSDLFNVSVSTSSNVAISASHARSYTTSLGRLPSIPTDWDSLQHKSQSTVREDDQENGTGPFKSFVSQAFVEVKFTDMYIAPPLKAAKPRLVSDSTGTR